jgi:hypothetical protein
MSCGSCQAIQICRKALLLRAWRGVFATKQFYIKGFIYNTVVLGSEAEQLRREPCFGYDILLAARLTRPLRSMFIVSMPSSVRRAL